VPIVEVKCNYVLPSMYIGHIKIILKMTMEISSKLKLYSVAGTDKYSAIFTEKNQISQHNVRAIPPTENKLKSQCILHILNCKAKEHTHTYIYIYIVSWTFKS